MSVIEIHIRAGAEADDARVDRAMAGALFEPWLAAAGGEVVSRGDEFWRLSVPGDNFIPALRLLRQACDARGLRVSAEVV